MKPMSRCKACGYIMETAHIPELCPACGLKATVFEPYEPKVSEERFRLLSLHMHPIVLHFPQAFVVTALGMLVLAMVTNGPLQEQIVIIARFNLIMLPLTVLIGAVTGMKDGQLRFRKLTTPALKLKLMLSAVFLILSVLGAALALTLSASFVNLGIMAAIALAATGVAVVLGRVGAKLIDSILPGK